MLQMAKGIEDRIMPSYVIYYGKILIYLLKIRKICIGKTNKLK